MVSSQKKRLVGLVGQEREQHGRRAASPTEVKHGRKGEQKEAGRARGSLRMRQPWRTKANVSRSPSLGLNWPRSAEHSHCMGTARDVGLRDPLPQHRRLDSESQSPDPVGLALSFLGSLESRED